MKIVSFGKLVRMIYQGETECKVESYPDRIICKKDGSVEFRKGFFYTMGQTAKAWEGSILADFAKAGIVLHTSEIQEIWNPWPKDSYFIVTVRPANDHTRFLVRKGSTPETTEIWQDQPVSTGTI